MTLDLFLLFHINIAFSAIATHQRPLVVERCYWPILRLAERLNIPVGVEVSGYSLAAIADIDRGWVDCCRRLIGRGLVELIGSGYSQLIGPLVPAEVNHYNLACGKLEYQRHLGCQPRLAMINEQAFSRGLVGHYCRAGYQAIIMEWENPYRANPGWPAEWRYYPQIARGTDGQTIPVIWNNSLAFQKMQRYIHGDLEYDGYRRWLAGRVPGPGQARRWLCIYGSDAEVFDFRPGRYQDEARLNPDGEWYRLEQLLDRLNSDRQLRLVPPSAVLDGLGQPEGGQLLDLTTTGQPVPVKKQAKYNLLRWAVSGRDDVDINSRCFRLYGQLKRDNCQDIDRWRELCFLWSSDFRTHITDDRWQDYQRRLAEVEREWLPAGCKRRGPAACRRGRAVADDKRWLAVEGQKLRVVFDRHKGLAIRELALTDGRQPFLFGTLEHGYYDDIILQADWYSGHLIVENVGQRRLTDLVRVDPRMVSRPDGTEVAARIVFPTGMIDKVWWVSRDQARIELRLHIGLSVPLAGTLRLGHTTLNPAAFDRDSLSVWTHNGG
ncbi:MAG: glycoside hydrolase family 57, partial [Negativicutes bacterium]|nr:glycoside hydrolase family 57 [Negativicutes bacterium]